MPTYTSSMTVAGTQYSCFPTEIGQNHSSQPPATSQYSFLHCTVIIVNATTLPACALLTSPEGLQFQIASDFGLHNRLGDGCGGRECGSRERFKTRIH